MKFAVQAGWLSDNIYIGRLNRAGDAFIAGKESATDMVLAAVAQYVMRNYAHNDGGDNDGAGMAVTFPRLGLSMVVRVTPLDGLDGKPVSGNEEGS